MTNCHLKMVSSNSTEKWRKYCIISIFHILFLMWDIWHVYLKYWYWFFFQYWLPQYFISILDEKNISFPLLCYFVEPNLKLKMRVQLMNAAGLDEAGIDGGGIFREFLSELLKTGFDPNRGLFLMTTDRLLYPNPQSVSLMDTFTKHYYFLGRMLGKVSYWKNIITSECSLYKAINSLQDKKCCIAPLTTN